MAFHDLDGKEQSLKPKLEGSYPKGLLCPLGGLTSKPSPLFGLDASSTGITWEKVTLTVDSGASDTVIPANMLAWIELMHSPKVGTEYEVANGEVVHNLGEKKCKDHRESQR